MNRKKFISAGVGIGLTTQVLEPKKKNTTAVNSFRLAHLTDLHILPKKGVPEKISAAFADAKNKGADAYLVGGDCIMDALKESKSDTRAQWKLWHEVTENLELPMHNCVGNHDVWGWAMKEGTKSNGEYGKNWAMEELKLSQRYYHFSKGSWDFLVLDSVFPSFQTKRGYTARLDEVQLRWLQETLSKISKKRNVCILSHIPIISFCPFFDGKNEESGTWVIPHEWIHIDARSIKNIFKKYKNIKLCLSGHIHLHDHVRYLGIDYLCNGAVSGNWWNQKEPAYQEFPPAYVMVEFFEDGRFSSEYIPFQS